ncbi:hypothetical protein KAJ89_04735 [Candidatus Parcubacteria bacterium]|nr:hypothetical protein [Candidatus Parcubacteria bacterium]
MQKKLRFIIIVFLGLTIITALAYYAYSYKWQNTWQTKFSEQELSFSYYFKPGKDSYTLLLGDLNGLNPMASQELLALIDKKHSKAPAYLLIPSILPKNLEKLPDQLQEEDFFYQVANEQGIVLVDNFCTNEWEKLKEKEIYEISALSPGPFCGSEAETNDLNFLLKSFAVKKVYIVYDTESYKEFVENFTIYLEENSIDYEFVQSKDVIPLCS